MNATPHILHDRYETLAELARGAQGTVYLARDHRSGRPVALKVWDVASEPDLRAYESEASLVESLAPHRSLPVYVDRFVERHYGVLVSDWVEGRNLDQVLSDEGHRGLAPSLVVTYLEQVARALDHLHGSDPPVVHGDVKPENMILTPDGTVVLVDFGSADRSGRQGTPGFTAPELSAGWPKSASSDIYALAATAVNLVTGVVPREGPDLGAVDPATARAVARGLRAGLAVHRWNRPPTASEAICQFRGALEHEHLLAPTGAGAGADAGSGARRERAGRPLGATRAEQPGPVPLPPALGGRDLTPYVGRQDILDLLREVGAAARDGCQAVLIAGEPGAGKTRTAAEVARDAFRAGATVLYGQCGPEVEVPYQPFAESLRWQVVHDHGRSLGPLAGELKRILPELDRYVPDLPAPLITDPRLEEHRTFDAVADWLMRASEGSGLVLVIDDLQWATRATLSLFQHVLKRTSASGSEAPILFVGTYRDTDLDDDNPLLAALPDLGRVASLRRVQMESLGEHDVSQLLAEMSGQALDETAHRVVRVLTDDSGGNPFFAIEILRNLLATRALRFAEGGWSLEGDILPTSNVQGAISRRFARLSEPALMSLSAASVIGMGFDLDLLSTLVGIARGDLLDLLDAVLGVGLLDETGPEHFRFEHALVRSTLYDAIEPGERHVAHRRVLGTLESLGRTNAATLASHALQSAPSGPELVTALEYALSAGEEAFEARAFGDAEDWSHRVLEAAGSHRDLHPLRIRALCLAGEAERDQGNPAFRESLLRAGHEALGAGLDELVSRSAIGNYRGTVSIVGRIDEARVELLREALSLEVDPASRRWALLAATLASDLIYDPSTPHTVRLDLVAKARAIARSEHEDSFLLEVLLRTTAASFVPSRIEDCVRTSNELVELADATGDPSMRVLARWATTATHLAAGQVARLRRYMDEAEEASRGCPPRIMWLAGLGRPQFLAASGDLSGARRVNDETLALGGTAGEPDALMFWSAVVFGLSLLEGNVGDLADLAASRADEFPEFPIWRIAHALALGAAGRVAEGREVVDRYCLQEIQRLPVDVLTLASWSLLALAAFHLDDPDLARALGPVLRSHSEAWSHTSVWILGPTRWDLGRCCLVGHDWDRAVALLERSVRSCDGKGLAVHAAVCRLDLVRALIGRDGPGDRERASAERDRGVAETTAFGLERRAEEFQTLAW